MQPDETETSPQQTHRFPCPSCGADYRFDPLRGALVCDFCGDVSETETVGPWARNSLRELDFETALAKRLPDQDIEETRVSSCSNCGAQVEFDDTLHATECPFCATPVVVDTGTHRHIKPRGVLPFALDESDARKAMNDWLGGLWFAPNGLQEYARKGRKMQGVYVPYWTFDASTRSSYRGERGTVYYETRTVTQDGKTTTERVQKIRWRPVSGRVARDFDDVLVLASRSLPTRYTDALEPWDLAALEPYQPQFLAGFRSESYALDLPDAFPVARDKMARVIERDVRFDIGGDRQRVHDIDTETSDVTFKHILLPVWVAAYKYRDKSYRFVVNGRTGQVQGERPWSIIKIALAILVGLILASAIGYGMAVTQ